MPGSLLVTVGAWQAYVQPAAVIPSSRWEDWLQSHVTEIVRGEAVRITAGEVIPIARFPSAVGIVRHRVAAGES